MTSAEAVPLITTSAVKSSPARPPSAIRCRRLTYRLSGIATVAPAFSMRPQRGMLPIDAARCVAIKRAMSKPSRAKLVRPWHRSPASVVPSWKQRKWIRGSSRSASSIVSDAVGSRGSASVNNAISTRAADDAFATATASAMALL